MILKLSSIQNDEVIESQYEIPQPQSPISNILWRIEREFDSFPMLRPRRSSNDELESPTKKKNRAEMQKEEEAFGNIFIRKRSNSYLKVTDQMVETKFMLDLNSEDDLELMVKAIKSKNKSEIILRMLKRSLSQLEVFKKIEEGISDEKYTNLMKCIKVLKIKQGNILFSAGQVGKIYYFLVKGSIYLLLKETLGMKMINNENQKTQKMKQNLPNLLQSNEKIDDNNQEIKQDNKKEETGKNLNKKNHHHRVHRQLKIKDENGQESNVFMTTDKKTSFAQYANKINQEQKSDHLNEAESVSSQIEKDRISIQWSHESLHNAERIHQEYPQYSVFGIINAGEGLGEHSLLRGIKRTATVVAKEDCLLLTVEKKQFLDYLGDLYEKQHREKIDFVKSFPMFQQLEKRLSSTCILFEQVTFCSGQIIYSQGQPVDYLYLLKKGQVALYVQRETLDTKEEKKSYYAGIDNHQTPQKINPTLTNEEGAEIIDVIDIPYSEEKKKFYVKDSAIHLLMKKSCSPKKFSTKNETSQSPDKKIQVGTVAENSIFGDEEIIKEFAVRTQEAKVLSHQVEVLRISVKNLKIICQRSDVIERLKECSKTKDNWRKQFIQKSLDVRKINHVEEESVNKMLFSSIYSIKDNNTSVLNRRSFPCAKPKSASLAQNQQQPQTKDDIYQIEVTESESIEKNDTPNKQPPSKQKGVFPTKDISCQDLKDNTLNFITTNHNLQKANFIQLKKDYIAKNLEERQELDKIKLSINFQNSITSEIETSNKKIQYNTASPFIVIKDQEEPKPKETKKILISQFNENPSQKKQQQMRSFSVSKSNQENQKQTNYHERSNSSKRGSLDYRQIHSIFIKIDAEKKNRSISIVSPRRSYQNSSRNLEKSSQYSCGKRIQSQALNSQNNSTQFYSNSQQQQESQSISDTKIQRTSYQSLSAYSPPIIHVYNELNNSSEKEDLKMQQTYDLEVSSSQQQYCKIMNDSFSKLSKNKSVSVQEQSKISNNIKEQGQVEEKQTLQSLQNSFILKKFNSLMKRNSQHFVDQNNYTSLIITSNASSSINNQSSTTNVSIASHKTQSIILNKRKLIGSSVMKMPENPISLQSLQIHKIQQSREDGQQKLLAKYQNTERYKYKPRMQNKRYSAVSHHLSGWERQEEEQVELL